MLPLLLLTACVYPPVVGSSDLSYPETRTGDVVDNYHGTRVADPYRWLEDDMSAETAAWVAKQNKVSFGYLDALPTRNRIGERLTELWNYEKFSAPSEYGGRWLWSRNDGLQNQSVIFVGDGPYQNGRVLLDPNTLSADGTKALSSTVVSEDGKYMAYAVSDGGSDWQTWYVLDVDSGENTGDQLSWTKFAGVSWMHDSSGFFYSRFPAPEGSELSAVNSDKKLYFHKLGTAQSEDRLIYYRPEHPEWSYGSEISEDGHWLIIVGSEGTERKNSIWYIDLTHDWGNVQTMFDDFDAEYNYLAFDGDMVWFQTNNGAPKGRIIAVDPDNLSPESWEEVVPESDDVLRSVSFIGGMLVCNYLHDAYSVTRAYSLYGDHLWDVQFPTLGSVSRIGGKHDDSTAWYSFTSFTYPSTVFKLDLNSGKSELAMAPAVSFDPSDYIAEQVWYPSKDGTRIPMFVVRNKDVLPNGNQPVQLYGYGGFNISMTPRFSVSNLVWMEMGGVFAMPNLRGGGEFGQEWHQAGTVHQKQNVFDDFIAAGEWLCDNGWTSPERLAIRGGSNGGLLVGACMTQRPDLFAACLPAVGVLDMLRYHEFTIGWAWASDFGTSADKDQFKTLYSYSPIHNVRDGVAYPATMITTGDHDDRVVPAHSFKFAATLQAAQAGTNPVLIRIETRGGHGAGKPTAMRIAEYADMWAFLANELGMIFCI
ncbi:MAG: S9 family peptidase [Planctomycetota bacterium]|nr:MAG: S9 family peptidase [Planctomycetota bacterium]